MDSFFTIARQHLICQDYAIAAAERIIDGTLKAGGSLTVDAENGEVILK